MLRSTNAHAMYHTKSVRFEVCFLYDFLTVERQSYDYETLTFLLPTVAK